MGKARAEDSYRKVTFFSELAKAVLIDIFYSVFSGSP